MKQNRVVSLAIYKARRVCAANKSKATNLEPTLPDAGRLWELLDKNISLSVWNKRN